MKFRIKEKMGYFEPQYSFGWIWRSARNHPLFSTKDDDRFYCYTKWCHTTEACDAILSEIATFEVKKEKLKEKGIRYHAPNIRISDR